MHPLPPTLPTEVYQYLPSNNISVREFIAFKLPTCAPGTTARLMPVQKYMAVGSALNKAIAFTRIFGSTDFFFAKMACTIISWYSNMVRMFHSSKKQCFGEVEKFCFFIRSNAVVTWDR